MSPLYIVPCVLHNFKLCMSMIFIYVVVTTSIVFKSFALNTGSRTYY